MSRVFEDYAYTDAVRNGCYWDTSVKQRSWPVLRGTHQADVVILGAGFVGLNAAIELAQGGASVVVLEAEWPGWGASGRNGGFCCMGGAKAEDSTISQHYGETALQEWDAAQVAAIDLVGRRIADLALDVERHSDGEIILAHSARSMARLAKAHQNVLGPEELCSRGIRASGIHGGVHTPVGFGLNPRRYAEGLAAHAETLGVSIYGQSPVTQLKRSGLNWRAAANDGWVEADKVLIASNGYSRDNLPDWLAGRYLPAQSSVMVTRPLTRAEQEAQGWTSDLMAYDTRTLLHYFRRLPDDRFLFGMRGGLTSSPRAEEAVQRRMRQHFDRMFPAWKHVEATHMWSGLVCLMPSLVPFVGALPDTTGLYAAMGWHGNGVAMGSYAGAVIGKQMAGQPFEGLPDFVQYPPRQFPLSKHRRTLLRLAYLGYAVKDLF
ncbi:NAD(P)/FAD-dependent oxidoreductase [Donghicola sp. XS_ASV15]|uniref:NAD(P)/FAD-dependent oxidoreductase n=1 Tax=Donghicola sp. XS_ASV15 TaxID=3241295 RepID=UPI00351298B3